MLLFQEPIKGRNIFGEGNSEEPDTVVHRSTNSKTETIGKNK
jgi:hypothetical protein